MNECIPNPCSADADCIDEINNYECICQDQFVGDGIPTAESGTGCTQCDISYSLFDGTGDGGSCVCNDGWTAVHGSLTECQSKNYKAFYVKLIIL